MKPTRECLIKSIESFYSTRESNKKEKTPREKTPKEKPKVKSRNHVLETPKLSTNREYLIEDPFSTPFNDHYSPPNSSKIQPRTPSHSPILVPRTHSHKKRHCSKKNNNQIQHNYCMRMFLIILLICLIFIAFTMFV